ncbi:MAG: pyridoxal-phosphate dependent enzyme [Gemmatimonadetes bacterium]|nr:pyridoxal-phosphate dependent enzyme [Gemmatimonadota bacterium]
MFPLSPDAVLSRLAPLARTPLATLPTPLLPAPALAASLRGDIDISIKADAWTGLGLGGNKVRKLEYELDPARLRGATDLVTAGGPHSNHCRVTAAAAARLGLGCTLAVNGEPGDAGRGNALLHRLLGARIVTVADRAAREAAMTEEASRIAGMGGKALVVAVGASTPRGALGYVRAAAEMREQVSAGDCPAPRRNPPAIRGAPDDSGARSEAPVWIFTSSSSGGTLAGLMLGCALMGWRAQLVGVSPDDPAAKIRAAATEIALGAAALLPHPPRGPDPRANDLIERVRNVAAATLVTDAFVGPGYGAPTRTAEEAIALFGARAGVILDPVYTGKAAAALIAWVREGVVPSGAHVILLHTGGHPALFR